MYVLFTSYYNFCHILCMDEEMYLINAMSVKKNKQIIYEKQMFKNLQTDMCMTPTLSYFAYVKETQLSRAPAMFIT